jgi:putative phosphonate metabolism protein
MFERYAIFYTPSDAFAAFGAAWLGWDSAQGCCVPHCDVKDVDVAKITATPRKYGLHATLKAPFRLADGASLDQLHSAAEQFAKGQAAFDIGTLELRDDRGFVALRPEAASARLQDFASAIVKDFDRLRAPLTDADIARRRKAVLNARQDQHMLDWGYPFIFEDFHFHLTLSGALPQDVAAAVMTKLAPQLTPLVPNPFTIDAITVMGQDAQGMFHQIHRYSLTG